MKEHGLLLLAVLAIGCVAGWAAPATTTEPQFTFAVIGDRTGSVQEGEYEKVLAEVADLGPDLIITVGDHIQGYTSDSAKVEGQWDEYLSLLDATGIQYYLTPGNHDIYDDQSRAIYRRRFGAPDRFFRFMGRVFVILDVSTFNTADALPKEKLDWLTHVLEASKNSKGILVFYHKPFWCEDFSAGRLNVLHDLFRSYPVEAVFTGHYHRYFHTVRDSIQYFGVSSSGAALGQGGQERGDFYSYLLGRAKGDSLSIRLLEPGIFTPVDAVTYDDAVAMARAEAKSVRISDLLAYGFTMSGSAQVTVTVENPTATTLRDTAAWVLRGDWAVQPMRDYIEVPPGETGTLTAFVRCEGSLFPVPILEMSIPCCDGRTLDVARPLNVKRVMYADYAERPPMIDGVLSEPLWQGTRGEGSFFGPQGGRTAADSTFLRVCYDSTKIYLAAECFDRSVGLVSAAASQRDALGAEDDAVTFLFEPLRESGVFYQIAFNPIGTVFDRKVEICPFGTYVPDPTWDTPVEVKTSTAADRWWVEAAIPISAMSPGGLGAVRWGFNFMRIQQRLRATAEFQAPLRYRSDAIGLLGFR